MPIIEVQGNLLTSDCKIIAHGANCFCTMGSGVAAGIRQHYPEAYNADQVTTRGDKSKLGNYTWAWCPRGPDSKFILNLYTQYEFGTHKRQLDYEALTNCLHKLQEFRLDILARFGEDPKIGIPRIGCGLAGGDWNAVKAIINYIFDDKDIYVYYL